MGGATFFLTVVTTVTAGEATLVFLSGGCPVAVEVEEEAAGEEVARAPLDKDVGAEDEDLAAPDGGLPPKKLIMAETS